MSDKQCRMITRAGQRCSRTAVAGGMGFCQQHIPVAKTERSVWKERLKDPAFFVSVAALFIQITELALRLVELKGPGDEQSSAKKQIKKDFPPSYPRALGSSYRAGARVDWKKLLSMYTLAKQLQHHPGLGEETVAELEEQFDEWFSSLNSFHKEQLLEEIEDYLRENPGEEADTDRAQNQDSAE